MTWLLLIFFSLSAVAQDTIDVTETVTVQRKDDIPTRDQLFKDISNKVSRDYVKEILGESKFDRSQKIIVSRIYNQADRFIPVMRNSPFEPTKDGQFQSVVTMKLSIRDLRELLLKEGLLSSSEGTPTVVTFISINDRVNARSNRWWLPDPVNSGGLADLSQKTLSGLKSELNSRGFFVADPHHRNLKDLIPPAFLNDSYKTEDLSFLGEYLGYELVISGKIILSRISDSNYRISVDVQTIQSSNGYAIAEVVRQFEVSGGAFEWTINNHFANIISEVANELGSQIQEVWQKGTMGSDFMKLVLMGDIEYKEFQSFKTDASKLPEIKLLRERGFERGSITFDVGSNIPPNQLVERLKRTKMNYNFSTSGSQIIARKR